MFETILGMLVLVAFLVVLCKIINKIARVFGSREISALMDAAMSIRMGDLSSKRKD